MQGDSTERRGDSLSGKISRQQSAVQLDQLLGGRERESGKLKSHADKMGPRNLQKQFLEEQGRRYHDDHSNHTEVYASRNEMIQHQLYLSNQRSITPTQGHPLKQSSNQNRTPLLQSNYQNDNNSHINQTDGKLTSAAGSNSNLLRLQRDDSWEREQRKKQQRSYQTNYTRKTEDRCQSDYIQNANNYHKSYEKGYVQSPVNPIPQGSDELQRTVNEQNRLIRDLKTQLQERENHLVVLQSEAHDTKLKLTRRIRQLEEENDGQRRQIDRADELQIIRELENKLKFVRRIRQLEEDLDLHKKNTDRVEELEAELQKKSNENTLLVKTNAELSSEIQQLRREQPRRQHEEIEPPRPHIKTKSHRENDSMPPPRVRSTQHKDESDSFLLSNMSEQTFLQQRTNNHEPVEKLDHLKISPISNKPIHKEQKQVTESQRPGHFKPQVKLYEKPETRPVEDERTPPRTKKDSHHLSPPLQPVVAPEIPKPMQSVDFSKANWWSNDKRELGRANTGLKNREQNMTTQQDVQSSSQGTNYKQNLNTIKSRLTDLQRNKSALENRMRVFEERLKERKQQEN